MLVQKFLLNQHRRTTPLTVARSDSAKIGEEPLEFTTLMREYLLNLGYKRSEVNEMTPGKAADIIGKKDLDKLLRAGR